MSFNRLCQSHEQQLVSVTFWHNMPLTLDEKMKIKYECFLFFHFKLTNKCTNDTQIRYNTYFTTVAPNPRHSRSLITYSKLARQNFAAVFQLIFGIRAKVQQHCTMNVPQFLKYRQLLLIFKQMQTI